MKFRLLMITALLAAGCGTPSFLITPVQRTEKLEETQVQPGNSAKIALIPIDGLIANAKSPGLLESGDNKLAILTQELDKAAGDSSVKAIVLRVNSPGGTVTGSDTMYELIRRFREKTGKPVVASIQEVGASGGYYVSLSADKIVAGPTSVVGSIGVIFNAFSFEGTLNKLGIKSEPIKSAALKDIGSPFHDISPAEQKVLQATVDEYFARFKTLVLTKRGLTDEAIIARATDGRVFSGTEAQKIGLIDQVGILEDAIDLARDLAHAKGARAVLYRKPFGPGGSVYASTDAPNPQMSSATKLELPLPESEMAIPLGFYYLWRP